MKYFSCKLLSLGLLFSGIVGCNQSSKEHTTNNTPVPSQASVIHQLNNQLAEAIILGTFSPCAAARVYAYANIAAYEAAIQGNDSFISYSGQLKAMPAIEKADLEKYIPEVALTIAFCKVGNSVVWHDYILDSARTKTIDSLYKVIDKAKMDYSVTY